MGLPSLCLAGRPEGAPAGCPGSSVLGAPALTVFGSRDQERLRPVSPQAAWPMRARGVKHRDGSACRPWGRQAVSECRRTDRAAFLRPRRPQGPQPAPRHLLPVSFYSRTGLPRSTRNIHRSPQDGAAASGCGQPVQGSPTCGLETKVLAAPGTAGWLSWTGLGPSHHGLPRPQSESEVSDFKPDRVHSACSSGTFLASTAFLSPGAPGGSGLCPGRCPGGICCLLGAQSCLSPGLPHALFPPVSSTDLGLFRDSLPGLDGTESGSAVGPPSGTWAVS